MLDPVEFGKAMASIVKEATSPLLKRIEELEARRPEKGEKGDPGQDAPPVEIDVADVVKELLAADGIKQLVGLEVEAFLTENPPADGKDGRDGERGPQGEKGDKGSDGAGIAGLLIDRDGVLTATFTDGRMKSLGVVVGENGKDGRNGADGRSVENLVRRYVPESHEIVETWSGPDGQKELRYPAGGIHHKGYWSEAVKAKAGESWTHNGTLWIANEDTADEPGTASKAWTIGARKGRDGKDGRNGIDKTAPVKVKKPKDGDDA